MSAPPDYTGPCAEVATKVAPKARCTSCVRQARAGVRMFADTVRILRYRMGALSPDILARPLFDVRCVERKCKANIIVTVGDALGYT